MADKEVRVPITAEDNTAAGVESMEQRLTQSVGRIEGTLTRVSQAVAGVFAADKMVDIGKELVATADQYKDLAGQVDLVNQSVKGMNLTMDDTQRVAEATHTSLEGTTNLVGSIARAGQDLGLSQAQVLELSTTINQANQLSAQGAEAAEASVRQLIQGLQSGVLRGDEFNAVMEESPRLAQALADGLGVPIGALRAMADAGELTSARIVAAFQSQSGVISKEFAVLPATVDRAMTDLESAWTRYIGEADKATGASAAVAKAVQGVAQNLDTLGNAAMIAGEATVAALAYKAMPAILAGGREMVGTITSLRAAQAAQNATLAQTNVRYDQFRLAARAAANELAYLTARQREGGAAAELYATQVAAASARLQAANSGIVTSRGELAKLSAQSSVAAGKIRGLFAAIPGPLKIAISVIGFELLEPTGRSLGELIAKMGEAGDIEKRTAEQSRKSAMDRISSGQQLIESNRLYRDTVVKTAEEVARMSESERADYLQRLEGAKNYELGVLRVTAAEKELGQTSEYSGTQAAAALQKLNAGVGDFERGTQMTKTELEALLSINAQQLIAQFEQLTAKGKSADEAVKAMVGTFSPGSVESVRGFGQALTELQTTGKMSADQVGSAWALAVSKLDGQQLVAFQTAANAAFGTSARDAEALAAALDAGVRKAIADTGQDWALLASGISKGAADALGDLDTLTGGLSSLQAAGVDTSKALEGAIDVAVQAADSDKAVQTLTKRVEDLGRRGAISGEQVAKALDAISRKADEITPGINSVAEAFKQLGMKTQQELDQAATSARSAFDTIANSGEASASQVQQAFIRYAQAAIDADGGIADAGLEVEASMYDVELSADSTGKTIVKAMSEGKKSVADLAGQADRAAASFDRMASASERTSAPGAGGGAGGDGGDSTDNIGVPGGYSRGGGGGGGVTLSEWAKSWAGIYQHAIQSGVPEDQARKMADKFSSIKPFTWRNGTELTGRDILAQEEIDSWLRSHGPSNSNNNTSQPGGSSTSTQPSDVSPAAPSSTPSGGGVGYQDSATKTVRIEIPGYGNFDVLAGQETAVEQTIRALVAAKGVTQ